MGIYCFDITLEIFKRRNIYVLSEKICSIKVIILKRPVRTHVGAFARRIAVSRDARLEIAFLARANVGAPGRTELSAMNCEKERWESIKIRARNPIRDDTEIMDYTQGVVDKFLFSEQFLGL